YASVEMRVLSSELHVRIMTGGHPGDMSVIRRVLLVLAIVAVPVTLVVTSQALSSRAVDPTLDQNSVDVEIESGSPADTEPPSRSPSSSPSPSPSSSPSPSEDDEGGGDDSGSKGSGGSGSSSGSGGSEGSGEIGRASCRERVESSVVVVGANTEVGSASST